MNTAGEMITSPDVKLSERYVPGEGPIGAKLAVVGEAPGFHEDQSGVPFSGPSGYLLNDFLRAAGLSREQVYVSNVVKYRPFRNEIKTVPQAVVDDSIDKLIKELREVRPNCILALGNLAMSALTGIGTTNVRGLKGISDYRGSVLFSSTIPSKVVPTIHPAALLHQRDSEQSVFPYSSRHYIQLDIARAVEESKSPTYNIPKKNITIIRSSSQLFQILRQYRGRRYVSIDIELFNSFPCSIALAFDSYGAIAIPLDNIPAKDWIPIPEADLCRIWKYLDDFFKHEPQLRTIGQNFKFDEEKLKTCIGIFCPKLQYDTSFLAHILHPEFPKSLAFLTSIYTRQPYYKDEGKEFNPKKDKFERFLTYNGIDAAVTYEICFELLSAIGELQGLFPNSRPTFYADEYYPQLHQLYLDIEREGFLVDKSKRSELKREYHQRLEVKFKRLESLVGHELDSKFVNSPKQVAELLYDELKIPQRAGTGEDVLIALLANVVKDQRKRQIIESILELRRDYKTLGTYINARPDYDGRMRTAYRIVGTETGRSSTSIMKPPVRPDKMGLAFQTLTKHGEGSEIRKMLVPDPGYVIMEWDLSQAEARIVALLANDEETLRLFDTIDIHAYTAGLIFGGDWQRYCKDSEGNEPVERFIGKTTRHACNYGMRKRLLMDVINTGAKNAGIDLIVSEWKAGKILEAFHSGFPKIEQVFQAEVALEIDKCSTLVNPYGRIRQFFGEPQSYDIYKEAYAFIPQSTVADHLKFAALRIRDQRPDFRIVMEVHDALVAQVKIGEESEIDSLVRKELERPIDFKDCSLPRGTIVIPTECQIGINNLKEMRKFKNAA